MLGRKVKKLRLDRGLTITRLAEKAGVAKAYLSTIERGLQSNPSIHIIEKLCWALGVPVETLIDSVHRQLDDEWIELVQEAMDSGISKAQFAEFLGQQQCAREKKCL